jgi:hypothetical protein
MSSRAPDAAGAAVIWTRVSVSLVQSILKKTLISTVSKNYTIAEYAT